MTTVAAGSTVQVTLPVGSKLTVSGQGTLQTVPPGGNGLISRATTPVNTQPLTHGPFSVAVAYVLMAVPGGPGVRYSFSSSIPANDTLTSETVTVSRNLTQADNGYVIPVANGITLTIPASSLTSFSCVVLPVSGATASIAFSGGATGNGAATTITRARSANAAGVAILQDYGSGQDAFAIGGV